MATAHATEVAGLKQKLDVADDDITLINRWPTRRKVCFGAVSICMYNNMSTKLGIIY